MLHVNTTCPDLDTARDLARSALTVRLAACANIVPGVVSLFHWQGETREEGEVQVTFKTRPGHRKLLVALIEDEHPYDLPVITWETVGTTTSAQAWMEAETEPL